MISLDDVRVWEPAFIEYMKLTAMICLRNFGVNVLNEMNMNDEKV